MHTKDILAAELSRAGLPDMAAKASEGFYHDYLSPLDTPCMQLVIDLKAANTRPALALLSRHLSGEFDASAAEATDWASSPEGRELAELLMGKRRR